MQAATLEQIRAVSDRIRALAQAPPGNIVRTVPEHAELRRLLVEWAEPEFLNDPSVGSSTLDARLSAQLNVAGLMHPNKIKDSPEFGDFGTVKALKLFHPQGDRDYLVLQTGMGILCGTSYAHYLYRFQGRRWVRVLALEPGESDGFYLPDVVTLERRNGAGDALFLVGGASQWCSSRSGRVGAKFFEIRGTEAKLVLQIRRMADRTTDPPLAASLLFDDLTLRYRPSGAWHSTIP